MYKIPQIQYRYLGSRESSDTHILQESLSSLGTDDSLETTNTIFPYVIRYGGGRYYVFYTDFSDFRGSRRPNEFRNIEEAKEWIEQIHYPSQIAKFLEKV